MCALSLFVEEILQSFACFLLHFFMVIEVEKQTYLVMVV
jgi:hypothetical protein